MSLRSTPLQKRFSPQIIVIIIAAGVILSCLSVFVLAMPADKVSPGYARIVEITPSNTGKPERCLTCHSGIESMGTAHPTEKFGCVSCHGGGLRGGAIALTPPNRGDPTIPKDQPGHPALHNITKQIPFTQCNHCHNRGNYDLSIMTFLQRTDLPAPSTLSPEHQRAYEYYQPIGKFTKCEFELDCIDCHTAKEVMGDGTLHNTKA